MENYEMNEPDFLEPPEELFAPVAGAGAGTPTAKASAPAPVLQAVERPMPGTEHPDKAVSKIEEQYMRLVGKSMSADVRGLLYGIMQENNIKSNDAALSIIITILYIAEKLSILPHNIDLVQKKAALDTVEVGEKIVQDEAKKTALRLKQEMISLIEEKVAGGGSWMLQMRWAIPLVLLGFFFGNCFTRLAVVNSILSHIF